MNKAFKQSLTLLSVIISCFALTSSQGCTNTTGGTTASGSSNQAQSNSNLPSFNTLYANYKRYGVNTPASLDISDPELGNLLGGLVEYNIDASIFQNTCAIRISDMLNKSGDIVPFISGQTSSSADGDKHIFRVVQLNSYLTSRYGAPQITGTSVNPFLGYKGIIIFNMPGVWADATGHTALWDGNQVLGGYTDDSFMFQNSQNIKLWVTN